MESEALHFRESEDNKRFYRLYMDFFNGGKDMKISGADIVMRQLEAKGVSLVTGIPGGSNLPLYHALYRSKIRHLLARHEQGAGFIAQGMARATGIPAVCFATSGPGATNLVTAIADARADSVPLISITGQVPLGFMGTDAFQEVDIYQMTIPITKHNFLVRRASDLIEVIPEAFRIASTGRPGPVLIDIPKDVQLELAEYDEDQRKSSHNVIHDRIDETKIEEAALMINQAERPLIFAGGGIIHAEASDALIRLARKGSIPVTLSLMGLGAFPDDDPLCLGMIGMQGSPAANMSCDRADLLIALGVRFDDRAVGKVAEFCPNASIIHVDIDEVELDKIKKSHCAVRGDVGQFIEQMTPRIERSDRSSWRGWIDELKSRTSYPVADANDPFHAVNRLRAVDAIMPDDAVVATDVGQHQMWSAQTMRRRGPRSFITSGGLGTMGFGLPAAIGVALAKPGQRVICVSGDGSIMMNIQELATLAECNLPVKIILLNNRHLGLVRQQQELFYKGDYIASRFDTRTDFARIAESFGIRGVRIDSPEELEGARSILHDEFPALLDIRVTEDANVLPMVPPGAANRDMLGAGIATLA
jgi:acetolactate synthase-1/2/3 large subunit